MRVRFGGAWVADTKHPVVLYESGFAPRWYVARAGVDESRLAAEPFVRAEGLMLRAG